MHHNLDKYQLQGELGRGSFGIVYRGFHERLQREVAIKTLVPKLAGNPQLKKRFLLEARVAATLSHDNLAVVYDYGESEGGIPFIVMEFVRGMPLSRVMQLPARLLPAQKLAIFRQICRGIAYVHRHNIVHRDIKPANIMIRRDGKVKIMDFGIAKVLSAEGDLNLTLETVGTVGTINYMSPEQIRGGELDHRSDIFSLGVLLYELICDRKPFGGSGLSDKIHNIQHEAPAPIEAQRLAEFPTLEPIIRRCLEKDPQERYQNVGELDLAIKQIQVQNQDLFREADFFPPEESPDASETLNAAPGEISGTRTFSGSAAGETTHLEVERPVAPDASRIRWMWAAA